MWGPTETYPPHSTIQSRRIMTALSLPDPPQLTTVVIQKKFNKYIDFARSIMRTLPAEKVPPDLTESHIYVKACDLYDGFYDQLGDQDLKDAKAVLGLAKVKGGTVVV